MSEKDGYQVCPYCAETIKYGASKCKHCHSMLAVNLSSPVEKDIINDADVELNDNQTLEQNKLSFSAQDSRVENDSLGDAREILSENTQNANNTIKNSTQEEENIITNPEQPTKFKSITPAAKERIEIMEKYRSVFNILMQLSYLVSLIFVGMGFYKMFAYNNPETARYSDPPVNAYVGGDAYNYIINANYATAFFAVAVFFAVIGMSFLLFNLFYTHEISREQTKWEVGTT